MPERVVSCEIERAALGPIIKKLPSLEYTILERRLVHDPTQDLHVGLFNPDEDFSQWDEGRAFGRVVEIHWLRDRDQFCIVVAGEVPDVSKWHTQELSLANCTPAEKEYLLWGVRDKDDSGLWWESRIPRDFHYPIPHAPDRAHPKLVVREYYDQQTGQLCFWRCLGFSFDAPRQRRA